jgi:CBS domain-containing protein
VIENEEAIMKVLDLMTPAVIAVGPTAPLREVLQIMLRRHLNDVLVMDGQRRLLGIVTYSDLSLRLLPSQKELAEHEEYIRTPKSMEDRVEEIASLSVDQVMTKEVVTVSPDLEILMAGATMTAHHVKQVPVVRDHKVVGIISHTDIGWGMMMQYPECMRSRNLERAQLVDF